MCPYLEVLLALSKSRVCRVHSLVPEAPKNDSMDVWMTEVQPQNVLITLTSDLKVRVTVIELGDEERNACFCEEFQSFLWSILQL